MAVAVNGTLTDIGGTPFPAGLKPVLEMVPSRSFRVGSRLVSRKPEKMTITGSTWSGSLEVTDGINGLHYTPRFGVFDTDGRFRWEESLNVEIHVPTGGGALGSFPGVEFSAAHVRVQPDHPRVTEPSFRGWWLNSVTSKLYMIV